MVSATRVISWRTPVSRSGLPTLPCRYFEATMLVAVMDQSLGTSTSLCSEITFELVVGGDAGLGKEAAEGEAGDALLVLVQREIVSGDRRCGSDSGGIDGSAFDLGHF